jgi:hypothetical protein
VMRGGYAPRTSPYPPGLSWRCFKRRNDTGFSRIPSRLAHRARPIRQYQAGTTSSRLLPPSPAIPGSGCLQLQPAAATASRWTVSHLHMVKQRLAAHTQNQHNTGLPRKINTGITRTKRYCPAPDGTLAKIAALAHGNPHAGQTG